MVRAGRETECTMSSPTKLRDGLASGRRLSCHAGYVLYPANSADPSVSNEENRMTRHPDRSDVQTSFSYRRRNAALLAACAAVLLTHVAVPAQETPPKLSLDQAFHTALTKHPSMDRSNAQVGAAGARVRQAQAGMMQCFAVFHASRKAGFAATVSERAL